ncbi:sialate:O-sulfotransferase 1-like [Clavelina lepadiformis]|uniref:sialate:O-sulfotransferase 1-like n=1 Tax=Clavelina lepadiformis TaxID=159417 RepID=UPI0040431399
MKMKARSLKCRNIGKVWLIYFSVALLCFLSYLKLSSVKTRDPIFESSQTSLSRKTVMSISEVQQIKTHHHCEVYKVGCFLYNDLNQEMIVAKFDNMTAVWCFSLCSSRLTNYAGLKSGDTCICAQDVTVFAHLQYTKCPVYCKGGAGTCGGDDAIDVYKIVSPCFQEANVPKNIEKSKFLGCFGPMLKFADENHLYEKDFTPTNCILFCDTQKLPLALVDNKNGCMCGQFNERFNLTSKIYCNQTHVKVYRTFSEDTRCGNIRLLSPADYKQTALVSFPGSGNTWTRYLLERATGIYTGSIYGDPHLRRHGFLAESPNVSKHRSVVVKDHMMNNNRMSLYETAILIVRNPYDAMVAEFNRLATDGNQTGFARENQFQSKNFDKSFKFLSHLWLDVIRYVVLSGKPALLIEFEELRNDPIATTLKMVKFLRKHTVISPDHLQQRILCLSQQLNGDHKRGKRKLTIDPFTKVMKGKFNHDVVQARKLLNERGVNFSMPKYERQV